MKEHKSEIDQMEPQIRYTRSTSRTLSTERYKSALTDHAVHANHVFNWEDTEIVDRESDRKTSWWRGHWDQEKGTDMVVNRGSTNC